mgnify:FL=1
MSQPAESSHTESMRLSGPTKQPVCDELQVISELLPLGGARLLELGCGAAEKTRQIVDHSDVREIVAAEVDQIQHQKNLALDDLPKVSFRSFGAEAVDEPDNSFDCVLMFKSLHHVPVPMMDTALAEIARVLKPGGLAYISEPVFEGDFNEIIRLFHDESLVRQEAFEAVQRAVAGGALELADERFFRNRIKLQSFSQFEQGILNVTHTDHDVTPELLEQVRAKFESYRGPDGYVFEIPNRVDLLRKRGS